MLKLILDMDFRAVPPAVDRSPFACHGRIIHADPVQDGASAASGALDFSHPDSAVRIANRAVWQKLDVLAIETWIFVSASGTRRNIVEGDGSFALFVDTDDTLAGSVFSIVDGAASPAWNVTSSKLHSPDGAVRKVPLDQWCKVVFLHDGTTRARLFIDDKLVASRGDFISGIQPVGGTGVVIGNWTLSNPVCVLRPDRQRAYLETRREQDHQGLCQPPCQSGSARLLGFDLAMPAREARQRGP
jgi:hypothetical protein